MGNYIATYVLYFKLKNGLNGLYQRTILILKQLKTDMGTAAPLLIYQICHEFPNRTAMSIRPHPPQNWGGDKNIIHEMTQVHGKDNVPSQNIVYRWIQNIKNGSFEQRNLELFNRS